MSDGATGLKNYCEEWEKKSEDEIHMPCVLFTIFI